MKYLISFMLLVVANVAEADSSYYTDDRTCLALNIYHEARSEAVAGYLAVGMVTLNRVKNKRYPNTICKVVWQSRQFSWTKDGKHDRPLEKKAWKHSKLIANYLYATYELYSVITNGSIDITDGAIYYYAHDLVNPYWASKIHITKIIGNHTFGRDKR